MDENNEPMDTSEEQVKVPESPKPLAFTIDFGAGKVDSHRHSKLVEKLRHRRGQSLSKIEGTTPSPKNKNSNAGNAARKSNNFQNEGYLSSEEKTEHLRNVRATANNIRLKDSPMNDKMTQSCVLPRISSPKTDVKEFRFDMNTSFTIQDRSPLANSSPYGCPDIEPETNLIGDFHIGALECENDKSDTASDAGTYTLDADNYSEEQKARMSIDKEFKIEQVSVSKRTEDYVKSLLDSTDSGNDVKEVKEFEAEQSRHVNKVKEVKELEAEKSSLLNRVQEVKELETEPFRHVHKVRQVKELEAEQFVHVNKIKEMEAEQFRHGNKVKQVKELEAEQFKHVNKVKEMEPEQFRLVNKIKQIKEPEPEHLRHVNKIKEVKEMEAEQFRHGNRVKEVKELEFRHVTKVKEFEAEQSRHVNQSKEVKESEPEQLRHVNKIKEMTEIEAGQFRHGNTVKEVKELEFRHVNKVKEFEAEQFRHVNKGKEVKESEAEQFRHVNKIKGLETEKFRLVHEPVTIVKPQTLDLNCGSQRTVRILDQKQKVLSPILSPTQQFSITHSHPAKQDYNSALNNEGADVKNLFNQILFPSPKEKGLLSPEAAAVDQGNIISVTSSGAFRSRSDRNKKHLKNFCLSKSGVQIEAYTENKYQNEIVVHAALTLNKSSSANLTANVIHVSDNLSRVKNNDALYSENKAISSCEMLIRGNSNLSKESNLSPGALCGNTSPTKIPSPIHSSRPRSRNSASFANTELSDSSLETDSYLKPTQNIIKSLQQRLSIDSDHELNTKYLNNDARNLLKKPSHLRHNSFDDKNLKISNKLEHFQNKNLQSIDQTYTNVLNHYKTNKIQNSPNNSPIRRSSSFSTKNQNNSKSLNISSKDTNILHSPSLHRNGAALIQRSASTTNIKPNFMPVRRSSVSTDHQKIDRTVFGDTESSSEEDFEKNFKKKDITNTRYNRAFSLRRARLEPETSAHPKCPNTPEMRRKFHTSESRPERAISVDRKPVKANEIQSRYLQNISKKSVSSSVKSDLPPKHVPISNASGKSSLKKLQGFSRTDSGRFSVRSSNTPKNLRKEHVDKKQSGGRSNSSLSSREVEFQNWKRRKSYDPMKAAAEGKRKAEMAKRQNSLTQSLTDANQDCDSSPSHSSSVHRSQSFHGTAALEQLISSDEEDLTLSVDEGFSPPTPSPCELSPTRASLRYAWKD